MRRRRDLGLCRKHAQTDGARDAASEQEKALHRDCPRRSASEGYHDRADGRHGRFDAAGRPQLRRWRNPQPRLHLASCLGTTQPSEDSMTKTILIALACAAGAVSMAQAQTSGAVGAGAGAAGGVGNSGSHGTYSGGASGGVSGGANVVTPPAAAGAGTSGGASGGATINQPAIDTNQAQQPGVGIGAGTSGGTTIKRSRRDPLAEGTRSAPHSRRARRNRR